MVTLVRYGRASARPALLAVPGIDGTPASLAPIIARLAGARQVVVADYSREENATIEQLADEVRRLAATAMWGPIDLLGQSIGSVVAAMVESRGTLPVRRVALCCTFTRLRWNALRASNAMLGVTPRPLFRLISPLAMRVVCGPVGDGARHPFFAASRDADPRGVRKRTAWQIGRDFASDLARIRRPLLVLMGDHDRFVPDAPGEIARLGRLFAGHDDARVEVLRGAGHVILPSSAVADAATRLEAFYA